jgi:hypothetical protein
MIQLQLSAIRMASRGSAQWHMNTRNLPLEESEEVFLVTAHRDPASLMTPVFKDSYAWFSAMDLVCFASPSREFDILWYIIYALAIYPRAKCEKRSLGLASRCASQRKLVCHLGDLCLEARMERDLVSGAHR